MANNRQANAARITAVGAYLPPGRNCNRTMAEEFRFTQEFLDQKIGILRTSRKGKDEHASDMSVKAFANLLGHCDVDVSKVDIVCVVTQNPDFKIPYCAANVHEKLGLRKQCMTFDISQGCAGYTHGVAIVSSVLEQYGLEQALLFTCDPYSNIVSPKDRNTALIFGDAATATLISRNAAGYVLAETDFGIASENWRALVCEDGQLSMDGYAVFSSAVKEVPSSIRKILDKCSLTDGDIDLYLLHQGSKYVVDAVRSELGLDYDKAPFEIEDCGNTVSSSIPILLSRHFSKKHRRIVVSGFGVGFSWASGLLEYRE